MLDSTLFARCLSQTLQGSLGVAACFCWAVRTDRRAVARGVRWGAAAAIPATAIATWLFGQTPHQAQWEAVLAAITLGAAVWFAAAVVTSDRDRASSSLIAIAALVAIVRQTMEMGVILRAAIVDVRSLDATLTIVLAIVTGLLASFAWVAVGRRLPDGALIKATRVFAVLFLAQLAMYAFHEAAEARWLPWSDVLHAATEPYGPDSTFGFYVTAALLLIPAVTAGIIVIVERLKDPIAGAAIVGALVVGCVVGIVATTGGLSRAEMLPAMTSSTTARPTSHDPSEFLGSSRIVFRDTDRQNADYGHLAVAALDAPDAARAVGSLTCARVSVGGDRGICVEPRPGEQTAYDAVIFDAAWKPLYRQPLAGVYSRTRTSADGRFGAVTTFTSESHGYTAAVFSTQTILLNLRDGSVIGDLEQFTISRQGRRFQAADFNFWGVTFAASDSNTFYATLRTNNTHYLVRGNIAERRATVIADNVECPSLSPDERRIAFKRLVGPTRGAWRLFVLDLATMTDRVVDSVTSYVDDQVEWLDADHILYALPHLGTADVWVAPVESGESASILIHDAESPIVVRVAARAVTTN